MDFLSSFDKLLTPFFVGLLVATGVGVIVGLEREFNTQGDTRHIGGIRTFILTTLLGYCAGWAAKGSYPAVLVVVLAGFFGLVGVAYYAQTKKGNMGLTTEIALFLTLMLGVLISEGFMRESLAVVVIVTLVLSLKQELHGFIQRLTEEEMFAFIKFIVLALLVLPMLPDEPFGPEGLLNLRDIGWIVVLVLSISFVGYLLLKFGGAEKGVLLTAIVGGLFSSTLVAWVFSAKSREHREMGPIFGAGIVMASAIMYIRVFVLTVIFARSLAFMLLPCLAIMLVLSLLPAWYTLRQQKQPADTPELSPGNPLDLKNAVFFVILYVGISLMMYASRQWFGPAVTYLSAVIAGVTDLDAVTISTAKWAALQPEQFRQAAVIVLIAVLSNSLFKLGISLVKGAPEMRRQVLLGFGPVLLTGAAFWVYWQTSGQ